MSIPNRPAKLIINSETFAIEVRASIEPHGYLYLFVDGADKFPHLAFFITPFIAELVCGSRVNFDTGVNMEFSGNNLGYCQSYFSSHPEHTSKQWVFDKNKVCVGYFRNGVSIKISGRTHPGNTYENYNPENPGRVIKTLEPLDYDICFFVENTDLYDFLKGSERRVDFEARKKSFVEALKGSSLSDYQGDQ